MKQHKYLEDNGVKREDIVSNWCEKHGSEPRSHQWRLERKIYGFDSRETWNMDTAFVQWLLERLLMYKDVCCVNLHYHKADYKGKLIDQEQAIDLMIDNCKAFLSSEIVIDKNRDEAWKVITELWAEWGLVMWW